ncbi:hypothetical protein KW842_10585 [Duganella sp. sic0402]|uniref:hypothetical protein n=1 Tax=Duganella sp. sic0402 TaxID=2854786 RepID=UPI001C442D19|nr:hypothetical protein [Duganella sp. sic0402]MBV7536213.1 hypothetical protein [Duganella sp. sic0402]
MGQSADRRQRFRLRPGPFIDGGATWLRINDNQHQDGGLDDAQFVVGDMNSFGNVFMSTAGRGIVFGKPADQ